MSFISASRCKGPVLLPKASVNGDITPVIPEGISTGMCLIMETDTPESDLSLWAQIFGGTQAEGNLLKCSYCSQLHITDV